ncbi:hypothetical protein M23134_05429 [Microscilla marina ATCC 23134]|uniref:Uncharacterized protein n=1 Tax=Microscilla marina ATCC 23134 TaxID=313606 RepID=A1ZHT9_MICM2|nr:hypothetical protein M23134_05429 [Microscilla marina ATCC 23134]
MAQIIYERSLKKTSGKIRGMSHYQYPLPSKTGNGWYGSFLLPF